MPLVREGRHCAEETDSLRLRGRRPRTARISRDIDLVELLDDVGNGSNEILHRRRAVRTSS